MKIGKLYFGDWHRFYCGIEIPAHEDPEMVSLDAATFSAEARCSIGKIYDPEWIYKWDVNFYKLIPNGVEKSCLSIPYDLLYPNKIIGSEADIKIHIINFLKRINKLKGFI